MGFILLIVAVIIVASILESVVNKSKSKKEKIRYIEGLNLSETLSRQMKTYMQTGKAPNDYYNISSVKKYIYIEDSVNERNNWISNYSNKLENVILFYKNKLLENINNGVDYKTGYGIVREVYLGKIDASNYIRVSSGNEDFEVTISRNYISSNRHIKCYYINALRDHNFTVTHETGEKYTNKFGDLIEDSTSYVYAYIKI